MAMDLYSCVTDRYVRMSSWTWANLLRNAFNAGWKPQGTEAPGWHSDPEIIASPWEGGYFSNDSQVVTADDAAALANALEAARKVGLVQLITEADSIETLAIQKLRAQGYNAHALPAHSSIDECAADLIALCREGGFSIA